MAGKLKEWARTITRDAHALYLAARDPRTPWYAKVLAIGIAGYALSPVDLIPDFIPVLGYVDDLLLVPLGIVIAIRLIPDDVLAEHRATASRAAERPLGRTAAVVIVCIWAASAALAGWLAYRYFWSRTS
jgi:uncharacterized membrane protein YkvA (DUF1232 family)